MILENLLLAFVAGLVVKSVDWLDDDKKSKSPVRYLLAIIYGAIIGYLIGNASFGILFLAVLIAQVLSRKIDTFAHRIGFITSFVTALFFHLPSIDLALFGYFLVLGVLDEVDYIGKLRALTRYRPFLKLGPVPLVFFGMPQYLAGIIAFDIGYELFKLLQSNKK